MGVLVKRRAELQNKRRENRRVLRLKTEQPIKVLMGSIGDDIRYEMITQNVSYTGFFLSFDKPGRFPFTPSSIMEVWLELEPGNPVFFNGKMARVVYPEDAAAKETGPGIGIRIVQISSDQEKILRQYIDSKISTEEKNKSENLEDDDEGNSAA